MKSYPPIFSDPKQLWPKQESQPTRRRSRRKCGIRALTPIQIKEVAWRYRQGESGPQLSQAFGVSVGVIYRVLDFEKISIRS